MSLKSGVVKPNNCENCSLLNVSICFDVFEGYGLEIPLHVGVVPPEACVTIRGKDYLYGAIAYHKEVGKYKIEFERSHVKFCIMDMEGTIYGMKLAAQLKHDRMVQDNFVEADAQRDAYEKFIHAHDRTDNEEHALDSDEEGGDESDDKVTGSESPAGYHPIPHRMPFRFDPSLHMTPDHTLSESAEKSIFLTWRRDIKTLPANPKKSALGKTHLKTEAHKVFDSPLNAFLVFLPIPIWETMVKESNRFCEQQRKLNNNHWISGHPWSHDYLTLQELMTFMSILIEMTLHPTQGRAYTYMWMNDTLYPFTKAMSVTRFCQIRSIIHLCDNESDSDKNKDADPLSKIRPLLQILKETLPIYLNIGDDLALDEAYVASKSKFRRFLIMYNPMKPGGKFHY
eukprot:scaffold48127_cov62-Attheya_sp.AAC.2